MHESISLSLLSNPLQKRSPVIPTTKGVLNPGMVMWEWGYGHMGRARAKVIKM